MPTAPPEIDDIRRRMALIRRSLDEDVRGVVEGAEAATDWRRYVRNYPLTTLGLAVAVGYLIVPRRSKTPTATIQVAPAEALQAVAAQIPALERKEKPGRSLVGMAFGMLAPVALRAAQGYALQFFEQWMAQKMAQQLQAHPELAAALGGQAGPPRGPQPRPPEARPSATRLPEGPRF